MSEEKDAPEQAATPAAPLLRVVNPDATPEEIAAIVAVFSSLGTAAPAPEPPRSVWADPARAHRSVPTRGLPSGRDAWRTSARPR